MTMRLDLHTRHLNRTGATGYPMAGLDVVLVRPDCYGCADCGEWFQFARQLVLHVCEERDYDEGRCICWSSSTDGEGRCRTCGLTCS